MTTRRSWLLSAAAIASSTSFGCLTSHAQTSGAFVLAEEDYLEAMQEEADQSWGQGVDTERGLLTLRSECLAKNNAAGLDIKPAENWATLSAQPAKAPKWPKLEDSADYAHLAGFHDRLHKAFSLTPSTLAKLAQRNGFALGRSPIVLFGLRGCVIANGDDAINHGKSIRLISSVPDHQSFRCVIGVWDRTPGRAQTVSAYTASTVPHASYMLLQLRCNLGANLLSTGLYSYAVGLHNRSKSGFKNRQVAAFCLEGTRFLDDNGGSVLSEPVPVLRTFDNLVYSPRAASENWEFPRGPQLADNLHSGFYYNSSRVSPNGEAFASAGCQVIKGAYDVETLPDGKRAFLRTPVGPWARMRQNAGLAHPPVMTSELANRSLAGLPAAALTSSDDGKTFPYMLLTGLEAQLATEASGGFTDVYNIVRFGSSGETARIVQQQIMTAQQVGHSVRTPGNFKDKELKLADGKFNWRSVWALMYDQQRREGLMETGIRLVARP